jgi:hypothetical protein
LALLLCSPGFAQTTYPRDFKLPVPLFGADSAWNQTVTEATVLPENGQQILALYRVLRGDTSTLFPTTDPPTTNWPFMDVTYDDYSIAISRAGSGTQAVLMRDYSGGSTINNPKVPVAQDGTANAPPPAGTIRPPGPQDTDADGHLVLYNPSTYVAYDFWQPTTAQDASGNSLGGGQPGISILEAGGIDYFSLRGPGANPDTYFSARAMGTPLLAGMILPEDVASGEIKHALEFAIPGPRNTSSDPSEPSSSDYSYPASTTETDFYNTDNSALAAGQRIRLKQTIVDEEGNTIDENQLAPITQMFLKALRTYGAYMVDNASGFTFSAEDFHTAVLDVSDDQLNTLIGQPQGTPLPQGKNKWQLAIEKLNADLELIPFAYGPWQQGQDPTTATITTANFEVVTGATVPTAAVVSGLSMNITGALQPGDSVTFTASGLAMGGGDVYYNFNLVPNYGTGDYDPNNVFQVLQPFSTARSCTHTFNETGSYIVVVFASSTATMPTTTPSIIGTSVTVGDSLTAAATGLSIVPSGIPRVGDAVTFTANGLPLDGEQVYYRFQLVPDYGTDDYDPNNNSQMLQDFSTDSDAVYTFNQAGKYIVVVFVSATQGFTSVTADPIIGASVTVE